MRILFCSQTHLSKELGGSKVVIELAEEMEKLGWKCDLISPADLVSHPNGDMKRKKQSYLREYLRKKAIEYDVIEYDHNHLPYPRSEFSERTLLVARSVLLAHHFGRIPIPTEKSWKFRLRSLVMKRRIELRRRQGLKDAHTTLSEADLINVANYDDQAELVKCDIPKEKIIVIPYGISPRQRMLLDTVSTESLPNPRVAFIGTFDHRKGATDFPEIVQKVCTALPGIVFRLLGTYRSEIEVLASFPKTLRGKIEVVPHYSPDELHRLLASCSVGVFPSYIEGFGLGVLEMLAASIPVFAYNSPGPPMMLPADYLVPRGDAKALSAKLIDLLKDQNKLAAARLWAKQQSQQFCWRAIARQTSEAYIAQWQQKQTNSSVLVTGTNI